MPHKIQAIAFDFYGVLYDYVSLRGPDIFDKLSGTNAKLVIASNGGMHIRNWLDKNNFTQYFYDIVLSSEIGFRKPDKIFFEILCERLGEKPDDVLFVDDAIVNIRGAKNCGLQTFHYSDERGDLDLLEGVMMFL